MHYLRLKFINMWNSNRTMGMSLGREALSNLECDRPVEAMGELRAKVDSLNFKIDESFNHISDITTGLSRVSGFGIKSSVSCVPMDENKMSTDTLTGQLATIISRLSTLNEQLGQITSEFKRLV